jgi:hypothetical protein
MESDDRPGKDHARDDTEIIMRESQEGVVTGVYSDSVLVAYETEDDIVEHLYGRHQFVDSRLPELGTFVSAHTYLIKGPRPEDEFSRECDDELDLRVKRKNLIEGDDTF